LNVARGLCLALAIVIGSIGTVGAEEWIMGTALTDEHEVIDNTCADNFFGNTWKTNKYRRVNGFGTLSSDGSSCKTKNKKARTVTRSGRTNYWILVEDRLDAASYSPELNYPVIEGGVIDVDNGLGVRADGSWNGELYALAEVVEYTQEEIEAAVSAAVAEVIDGYVTSEELVEYVSSLTE
jgi:hypothetical protein